jgi:hypothetical protein
MKIPRKQSDILVKTYLEYEEYVKSLDKDNYDNNDVLKNTVKIFYQLSDEQYNKLTYQTALDLNQIIVNILKVPQKLVIKFKHNKKWYAINPNFDDLTMAEWVDLDCDDVFKQISILYRPIKHKLGKKYTIEPYKADISIYEGMKEWLTLDIYTGFVSFFLNLNKELLNYTLNSLMEDQDLGVEVKKTLQESGHGFHGLTDLLATISLN